MQERPTPFWIDPSPLTKIRNRAVIVKPDRKAAGFGDGYQAILIVGDADNFRRPDWIRFLLRTIAVHARFADQPWKDQEAFLLPFCRSFFEDCPGDTVAWFYLRLRGLPFNLRNNPGRVRESTTFVEDVLPVSRLGKGVIEFLGQEVPTAGLHMASPDGTRARGLVLVSATIERELSTGPNRAIPAGENWIFLADPAMAESLRHRPGTLSPAAEQFRDRETKMQTAPFVKLARLASCKKCVESRCFTMTPGQGLIADFRDIRYTTEYYFCSESAHPTLFENALDIHASEGL